ncbi:MAG: hypothetical protein IKS48_09300 [Eubacterium sp.]|nr:hypothetical protein [Eubacterium sp.]
MNQLAEFKEERDVSWQLSFVFGAIIGAIFFVLIYGVKILDITYDDWLYRHEFDLTQHYLGWRLYRESSWHFPLGLCDTSMYPNLTSVIYTDSIPLFALFFKILSPILPKQFQYFGLFGIISFMLQGGVSKIILRKHIEKEWVRNVGVIFFVGCIAFIQRMFWETALSSHFLILLAIALFIYRKDIKSKKNNIILWCCLGALTVSIHIYLYGMISVMFAGFVLLEFLENVKDIKRALLTAIFQLMLYLLITVSIFSLFGGFYGTVNLYDPGSGILYASITALMESKGYSLFFPDGTYSDFQLESLCYLGIAMGILVILSFIGVSQNTKDIIRNRRNEVIVGLVLFFLFFLFSISPVWFLGDRYLFTINIFPSFIVHNSWGIFRACGRFMWPIMYFLMYLAVTRSQYILKQLYPITLVILACLQMIEFSGSYKNIHDSFVSFEYLTCPADAFYQYDISQYKHIQLMKCYTNLDYYSDLTCYYEMVGYARLATDKGLTLSNFNFARNYSDIVQAQIDRSYDQLRAGQPDKDTLYVFPKDMYLNDNLSGKFDNVYEFDLGYDIVLVSKQ